MELPVEVAAAELVETAAVAAVVLDTLLIQAPLAVQMTVVLAAAGMLALEPTQEIMAAVVAVETQVGDGCRLQAQAVAMVKQVMLVVPVEQGQAILEVLEMLEIQEVLQPHLVLPFLGVLLVTVELVTLEILVLEVVVETEAVAAEEPQLLTSLDLLVQPERQAVVLVKGVAPRPAAPAALMAAEAVTLDFQGPLVVAAAVAAAAEDLPVELAQLEHSTQATLVLLPIRHLPQV